MSLQTTGALVPFTAVLMSLVALTAVQVAKKSGKESSSECKCQICDIARCPEPLTRCGLSTTFIYGLDLSDHRRVLLKLKQEGILNRLTFCACELGDNGTLCLNEATVLSTFKQDFTFEPYRKDLYTIDELYAGFDPDYPDSYNLTQDHIIYRRFVESGIPEKNDFADSIARKMHDACIAEALNKLLLPGRNVCAIMGGHDLPRGCKAYRDAVRIARSLTRVGMLVCSGGGPGAMEACNLGVWFANRTDEELEDAIQMLSTAPSFKDREWLPMACRVRRKYPLLQIAAEPVVSLGIPTFFYGHEPPNMFQTHVAKFFANSIREDALVSIAYNGIIFFRGSAGTVQELFQDGCQNHYEVYGFASPMVLMGKEFWDESLPAYKLLTSLAKGKAYEKLIYLVEEADQAIDAIVDFYHMKKPFTRRLSSAPTAKTKVPSNPNEGNSSAEKR